MQRPDLVARSRVLPAACVDRDARGQCVIEAHGPDVGSLAALSRDAEPASRLRQALHFDPPCRAAVGRLCEAPDRRFVGRLKCMAARRRPGVILPLVPDLPCRLPRSAHAVDRKHGRVRQLVAAERLASLLAYSTQVTIARDANSALPPAQAAACSATSRDVL